MTRKSQTADIVIIGAGVMGTSIAFHLARRGAGRVMVVEREGVASGGSGRSSALIRMHYSFPPEVQLAVLSLEMFQNWSQIFGGSSHFRRTGFVRIVPASENDRLRANVTMQQQLGANTQILARAELRELLPEWELSDVEVAAYEPDSGYGDGAVVAGDFLLRARELGVTYRPGVRVTGLRLAGDRIAGVDTNFGSIDAPAVVTATGPWSRALLSGLGVDLAITSEYHEVAILQNPPTVPSVRCACIDSILQVYFRPETGNCTLVGNFYGPQGVDPDRIPEAPFEESLLAMVSSIVRRIPALDEAGIARGVTGIYDTTPDGRPLLGEVPGIAGLYVAAGFSGMGFKIAPAVGLVMSELLLDGRTMTIDCVPFRVGRFAEGQPIRGEFEYHNE